MNESKVDKVNFYNKVLGKEMSMLIYLPESYNSLNSLPVLYFLHGRSGSENIMLEMNINIKADGMIKSGEIEPVAIVCMRIENSRGINSYLICK